MMRNSPMKVSRVGARTSSGDPLRRALRACPSSSKTISAHGEDWEEAPASGASISRHRAEPSAPPPSHEPMDRALSVERTLEEDEGAKLPRIPGRGDYTEEARLQRLAFLRAQRGVP